ncbi:hypothetical protein [Streptomyces aureus]|uniref:hypothetical protein n=1 Tax=Streptomyces aureus TaxID=193461 RepID=UPI000AA9B8F2|nr:hypothetical protein [Streptomyces aureus]
MSEPFPTPSQAEGERTDDQAETVHPDVLRTTPSQAEGEDTQDPDGDNAPDTQTR